MATLNGTYIHVTKEDFTSDAELLSHPAETGIKVTDHVQREAYVLNITGIIPGENADSIAESFMSMQEKGEFVVFSGRHYFDNALIQNFKKGADSKDIEGYSFSMTIREIRLVGQAKKPKVGKKSTGTSSNAGRQQTSPGKSLPTPYEHPLKKGETGYALAKEYGVPFAQIEKLNPQLKGKWDSLPIGEKIRVQ